MIYQLEIPVEKATVFSYWNDLPSEMKDYFEECSGYLDNPDADFVKVPLDLVADDFVGADDFAVVTTAYQELVTFLKANMLTNTTTAIVN